MNQGVRIRQITDAAVIVAIYAVFLLLSRFTGGTLEYDLFFIVPLPMVFYSFKYDWQKGMIPVVSSFAVSFLVSSNVFNPIVYLLPGLIMGNLLGGVLFKKGIKPILCILIMTIFASISEVLSCVVLSSLLGIADIFTEIDEMIQYIEVFVTKLNISAYYLTVLSSLLYGIVPSFIILLGLMDSVLVYLVSVLAIQRMKVFKSFENAPRYTPFKFPKVVSYSFIVVFIFAIIAISYFSYLEGFLYYLALSIINIFVIGSICYIYFGIKFIALYARCYRKIWLLLLCFIFIFIVPFIISFIGLISTIFDFETKILYRISKHTNN